MFPININLVDKALNPRESAKKIYENSVHVKINEEAIKNLALFISDQFLKNEFSLKNWKDHELHPKVANEDTLNFIFVVDILNFCFWPDSNQEKFSVRYNGISYTGYWSLVAAIKRAHDDGIPFCDAQFMKSVTTSELAYIFRSDSSGSIPLIEERTKAINEAGGVLIEKFQGSFINCVKLCGNDVILLLKILQENFTSLQDICQFNSCVYAFLKRAQIIIADIWGCFEGKGLGYFKNINEITMFADYRVPQTLEYFKVLNYSDELKNKLNNLNVMANGDKFEVEIRGCSIHAVEILKYEVKKALLEKNAPKKILDIVNSITLDFYLWDYARNHRKETEQLPFHRVRTIYY